MVRIALSSSSRSRRSPVARRRRSDGSRVRPHRSRSAPAPTPGTPVPTGMRVEVLAAQSAYDGSDPLGIVARGSAPDGTLTVRDIEFTGAKGGRARAYVITPPTSGPHPAMVFVAGSNQRREDIRAEALGVARRGVVALVLEQSQITAAGRNLDAHTLRTARRRRDRARRATVRSTCWPPHRRRPVARRLLRASRMGAWLGAISAARG